MRVLGISPTHDSSACLVNNGQIEYFCKEERLTRIKRDIEATSAIQKCIDNSKGEIDFVVICSPTPKDIFNFKLEDELKKRLKCKIIQFSEHHHLAHASLAFYNSGFEKSLTVVIDRNGAKIDNMRESESIFISDYPNNFKPIYKSFWLKNIGTDYDIENYKSLDKLKIQYPECEFIADSIYNITKVYESATTLIGQNVLENGKTMGLAAYGKDKPFDNLFVDGLPNNNLFFVYENEEVGFKKYINYQTRVVPKHDKMYADYAFQVQKQTQEQVYNLVKKYVDKTNIKNVCVTGGYGLNVVSNGYLTKMLPDVNFYFEPLADDTGNSIGSAMFVYRNETKDNRIYELKNTFFNNVVHDIPKNQLKPTTTKYIAEQLQNGKIVAVFNGKSEAGPRALGNRSILFDPRNKNAKDIINKVKNREWYRPFACSILKEYASDYFDMTIEESPYMTVSFDVKQDKLNEIPGVIHIDNSCRIQTVSDGIPHFYDLLNNFYELTGVPVLLNTSFNVAGEPLVETFNDCIDTYEKTDIDIVWFPSENAMITHDK